MSQVKLQRTIPPSFEIIDYKKEGFCVARKLLDATAVKQLRENADRFIAHEAAKLGGRDINFTDGDKTIVNSIHKLHEDTFFSGMLHESEFRAYAAGFLEEGATGRACEMFAKPAGRGLRVPAHQDNAYWCISPPNALTAWIALDSADFTNGGVYYVPGSHKLGQRSHGASGAPGSSQELFELEPYRGMPAICPSLAPGDVIFHHVLTLHWSHPNTSPHARRGITLQYVGETTKVDLSMKQAYEASLQAQIREREASAKKG